MRLLQPQAGAVVPETHAESVGLQEGGKAGFSLVCLPGLISNFLGQLFASGFIGLAPLFSWVPEHRRQQISQIRLPRIFCLMAVLCLVSGRRI